MKTKNLLQFGYAVPIIFWFTLIIGGIIYEDYNHLSYLVSELGTRGSETQYLFTTGLVLSAVFSFFMLTALLRICKKKGLNQLPVFILFTFTFSTAGAAIFPLPLRMHLYMGMPSIILFLSPILAIIFWSKKIGVKGFVVMSLISFFIMSLGFSTYFYDILPQFHGLKQRFFHLGWTVWFVYLTYAFSRLK